MGSPGTPLRSSGIGALVVAVALGGYLNALPNGFVFDDHRAITGNRCVTGGPSLRCAFSHDLWGRPGREVGRTWRPLAVLSFALDWAWGGGRPFAFHLVNALLHAGVSLLVLLLARRLTGALLPAALAALLFATLAVHTEAVAGVVGRADVLVTAFGVAALLLHLRLADGAERSPSRTALLLGGVAALLLVALLMHELAVLVPVMMVACERARGGRLARPVLWSYLGAALIVVGYLGLRQLALGRLVGPPPDALNNPAVLASAGGRVLLGLALVHRGVAALLVPLGLSAEYGHAQIVVPPLWSLPVLLGALELAALAVGALLARRRGRPALAAGAVVLLGGLVLLSNVPVLMPTAFGERLLYLPSVGLALLVAGLVPARPRTERGDGRQRVLALAVCGLLVVANLVITVRRNLDWRDDLTLYESAARAAPASARAHLGLGLALNVRGRHAEAAAALSRALELEPRLDEALRELAIAHDLTGRTEEAGRSFAELHRRSPADRVAGREFLRFLLRHREHARAWQLVDELRRDRALDREGRRLVEALERRAPRPAP